MEIAQVQGQGQQQQDLAGLQPQDHLQLDLILLEDLIMLAVALDPLIEALQEAVDEVTRLEEIINKD